MFSSLFSLQTQGSKSKTHEFQGFLMYKTNFKHIFCVNQDVYFSTFWNTYQCYLKKTERQVHMDTKLIEEIGVRFSSFLFICFSFIQVNYKLNQEDGCKNFNNYLTIRL